MKSEKEQEELDDLLDIIVTNIEYLIKSEGVSLNWIYKNTKVSKFSLQLILARKRMPSLFQLCRMANAFDITVAYFLNDNRYEHKLID